MWQLSEANKVVSQKMKVLSYQKHLNSLKNIKAGIKIQTPWKPSFSLSKRHNKYQKFVQTEKQRHNQKLMGRILQFQSQPMKNTINIIPRHVPSNKDTFIQIKQRQRKTEIRQIMRQNLKIVDRIENCSSEYSYNTMNTFWKENKKHRQMILKKQCVPDYFQLAKQYEKIEESRISRPRTAFTPINRNQEQF